MDDQISTMPAIQPHNERAASVWSSGGRDYEEIIRGVYDGIDTTVARLNPHPGERILDVATGTGITARACARRTKYRPDAIPALKDPCAARSRL